MLIAGDRRATAGNIIMYDRADKVIELDQDTIIAIAGSPAVAFEMARTLQTSFQYYRRSQLQALTLSAKVRALGKLIKDNLPMTLQGVGAVVPILAARDPHHQPEPSLYFYDALGAQFQAVDFAVSGSGSPAARSVLQWINRWSGQPTVAARRKAAVQLALQLLDVAAESDSATGGVDRRSHVFPQVKLLTRDGLRSVSVGNAPRMFYRPRSAAHVNQPQPNRKHPMKILSTISATTAGGRNGTAKPPTAARRSNSPGQGLGGKAKASPRSIFSPSATPPASAARCRPSPARRRSSFPPISASPSRSPLIMGDDGGYSIAAELKVKLPGMEKAEARGAGQGRRTGLPLLEGHARQRRR